MSDCPPRLRNSYDERQLRFERTIAAVLLFSGFVWERDLVVPFVALVVTIALIPFWSVRPFGVPFERLIGPRLKTPTRRLAATVVRTDDLGVAFVLLIATLLLSAGLNTLSRIIGLLCAGALLLEASAGIWLTTPVWKWLRSGRRP